MLQDDFSLNKLKKYLFQYKYSIHEIEELNLVPILINYLSEKNNFCEFNNFYFNNDDDDDDDDDEQEKQEGNKQKQEFNWRNEKQKKISLKNLIGILHNYLERIENFETKQDRNYYNSEDPLTFVTRQLTGYFVPDKTVKNPLKDFQSYSLPLDHTISMISVERIVWQKVKERNESTFPGNQLKFLESTVNPFYDTTIQGFSEGVNEIPSIKNFNEILFQEEIDHSLIFTLNSKQMKYQTNSLQEIKRIMAFKKRPINNNNKITITYRRIDYKKDLNINKINFNVKKNFEKLNNYLKFDENLNERSYYQIVKCNYIPKLKSTNTNNTNTNKYNQRTNNNYNYNNIENIKIQNENNVEIKTKIIKVLKLLTFLNRMNNKNITISPKTFINNRLSSKVNRQLDLLVSVCYGLIPLWVHELMLSEYKFLFDFKTRLKYFKRTTFGIQRTIKEMEKHIDRHVEKFRNIPIPRIPRFKVRITRGENLLNQAIFIMKMPQIKYRSILEVQYFNEVGTGSGPTNEFFTLISNELCLKNPKIPIWYDTYSAKKNEKKNVNVNVNENENENKNENENENENEKKKENKYIFAQNGLWPLPLPLSKSLLLQDKKIKSILLIFEFMGAFVAKAILDKRTIGLPFSLLFWKYALGYNPKFSDLQYVVPDLYKFLRDCTKLIKKKKLGEKNITYNGMDIKDLFINFTLPGYPDFELIENGKNTYLNINNLEQYVNSISDHFLNSGIENQLKAFKRGFNKIMSINHLNVFKAYEIDRLVNGEMEKWSKTLLLNSIICEHGYQKDSKIVLWLINVLSNLNNKQKHGFLKFCTGSARLPVGGIANLNPKLTIVKSDQFKNPDSRLPTCMTCVNFLKIPPYSSENILKEKLLKAISEGQDSFHLS